MNELDTLNRYHEAIKGAKNQTAFFSYLVDYLDYAAGIPAFSRFLASISNGKSPLDNEYFDSKSSALDHAAARILRMYYLICVMEKKPNMLVTVPPMPFLRRPGSIPGQLHIIRQGGTGDRPELDIAMVGADITRLHNRFLTHFGAGDIPRFDPSSCRLYVQGKEIRVRRVSNQFDVLRVIFAKSDETGKEWFFDDVAEQIDSSRPNERKKKYYHAFYQIGVRLAAQGLPDFFILTAHSAQINPKYLSVV